MSINYQPKPAKSVKFMLLKNIKKLKIILYLPLVLFFITNLFYYPLPAKAEVNATMPNWKMPDLQVDIGGLKNKFTKPTECGTNSSGNKIYCIKWIGEYIAGLYKYAIGIVGILAAVVLMIGGVMWIIAGGSATMIGEAKAWIGASLTGLVIALTSYLILYQVNPALTIFQPLRISQIKKIITKTDLCGWQLYECAGNQTAAAADSCGETPGENYYCCCAARLGKASAACSSRYRTGNVVSFDSISEKVSPLLSHPACKNIPYDFDSYGASANILRALAATESSCEPNKVSPAGACGLMQLMPATAVAYDARADCEKAIRKKALKLPSNLYATILRRMAVSRRASSPAITAVMPLPLIRTAPKAA